MSGRDGFHPDLTTPSAEHVHMSSPTVVHHVRASELSSGTAQTEGMQRFAAISGGSVGSEKIWMGETYVSPETVSDNHHHGESETAIFVRSGNPAFVPATTSSCRRTFRIEKRIRTAIIRGDRDCTQHTRGNRGESSRALCTLRESGRTRSVSTVTIGQPRRFSRPGAEHPLARGLGVAETLAGVARDG
jgi:hypothetical protein